MVGVGGIGKGRFEGVFEGVLRVDDPDRTFPCRKSGKLSHLISLL